MALPEEFFSTSTPSHSNIGQWARDRVDSIQSLSTAVEQEVQQQQHAQDLRKSLTKALKDLEAPLAVETQTQQPPINIKCSWIVLVACVILVSVTQGEQCLACSWPRF